MPSVHANPLTPPVQASPVEAAVPVSAVAAPARDNPFGAPPPNPFGAPPPNPFGAPSAQASTVEMPVHASPIPPAVYERSSYVSPVVRPAEDFNPIVRPVVEERLHTSPAAPAVRESAVANAFERPVVESAIAQAPVVEAAIVQPPLVEPAVAQAPVVEAAIVQPPLVEPAIAQAPLVEAAIAQPPVVEPAIVQPPLVEPAIAQAPVVEAPLQTSSETPAVDEPAVDEPAVDEPAVDEPAVDEPAVDARVQANAFETAPTEFASSETPITQADRDAASAGFAPVETSAGGESVVGEGEIQEQAAIAQPFPALNPARSFTSSGSEMPVVITTPAPYRRDSAPASKLLDLGREYLPRAQAWSKKNLRTTPRGLVIAAPLVALLGIWAIRSAVSQPKPAEVAAAKAEAAPQIAAATPAPEAPEATAATSAGVPAAPGLAATSVAPSATPPAADPAELASATSHGLPALEALAQKFPSDPQVGIALASQQAQAQRFEAAVESVERVISVDAKSAQNGKVMGILWRAAQSGASEPSFLALRKLGARGADIAFDLATTSGVRDSVRERAKTELEKSLSSEASADTRVASALLLAPDCAARKSLLARAELEGGKRTQAMLERFSRGSACTSNADKACNSCLTGSPELAHALAQLGAGGQK
jgi:hypothetical protein